MDTSQTDSAIAACYVVDIGNRPIRIFDDARKAQQRSHTVTIQIKARSCNGRSPHRALVHIFQRCHQAGHVAQDEFNRGPQIMPKHRNLCRLAVRV